MEPVLRMSLYVYPCATSDAIVGESTHNQEVGMPSDKETSIEYRLPITYVRVTGGIDEVHDKIDGSTSRTHSLTITAETGADLSSLQKIPLSLGGKSDVTFNLTADGRLTGTVLKRTGDDRSAVWKAAVSAAGTVVGAAGPALLAQGPPGWAALAGAAVVAGGATVVYSGTRDLSSHEARLEAVRGEGARDVSDTTEEPLTPQSIDPAAVGVPDLYLQECPTEALVLARYRAARKLAAERHSVVVHALLRESPSRGTAELRQVEALLRSIEVGLSNAEREFAIWQQKQRTVKTTAFDERFRGNELPTADQLAQWCASPTAAGGGWRELAVNALTVVSIDLVDDPVKGEPREAKGAVDVFSTMDVMYRSPRPAILQVWRLTKQDSAFEAAKIETRRLDIILPGNEKELSIRSNDRETLDLGFDADGALTKVVVSSTSAAIRRAEQIDSTLTGFGTAITAGKDIRDAISPASLVDQLAERKAAGELGLIPTPEDPLKALRDQLEEARLRAQLRVAEQINSSSIVPVVVQFSD